MKNHMSPELEALARFATDAKWEDLPGPIVHEIKRLLLDSIGCALTGISVDPGKMIIALARRLGGPPEASIIGVGDKVSLFSAVLANGQLINATDYDAFISFHGPGYLFPAPLAVAEATGASGKDLILATALACEIAVRVKKAVQPDLAFTREREGYANMNFGAAAGVGKLLNLDREKMMNALGIAGHACQVLTWTHLGASKRGYYPKYGFPGWQGTGAVMAALLAEMGYVGDPMVFDPEHGFWKFAGYGGWAPENITEGLGKTWTFTERAEANPMAVTYKLHICCKIFGAAVDGICDIIEKNNLTPEDIESVKVYTPLGSLNWIGLFRNTDIGNIVDAQFSLPFNISVAAHKVPVGVEWQDIDTMRNPKILAFMKKVSVIEGYSGWQKENVHSLRNRVEVAANGKTFAEDRVEARGISAAVTDGELEKKFRHNAARILTEGKIEGAVKAIWNLEQVENISQLMDQIAL